VGGDWPELAEKAAKALTTNEQEEVSLAVELLRDIRTVLQTIESEGSTSGVFWATEEKHVRIASASLVDLLLRDKTRPWDECNKGKPLTQNKLARMLRRFGIKSQTVRIDEGSTPKGFKAEDFDDAFRRYLPT